MKYLIAWLFLTIDAAVIYFYKPITLHILGALKENSDSFLVLIFAWMPLFIIVVYPMMFVLSFQMDWLEKRRSSFDEFLKINKWVTVVVISAICSQKILDTSLLVNVLGYTAALWFVKRMNEDKAKKKNSKYTMADLFEDKIHLH